MPVFLQESEDPKKNTKAMWLDPDVSFAECFKAIMQSTVYDGLTFYEVGDLVNSIKHDKPEILLPKAEYDAMLYKQGLGKYFTKIPVSKPSDTPVEESK